MDERVEAYFGKLEAWEDELRLLRDLCLEAGLEETFKWMHPCFTKDGKNIAILQEFKDYCAILFQKGALLDDPEGILVAMTENLQAARQIRFRSLAQVKSRRAFVSRCLASAVELERSGAKVAMKGVEDFAVPEELLQAFAEQPKWKSSFEALTPGRRKGYLLHFAGAKQSATRRSRIEACIPRILLGKGLTDCVCGHSARMPTCDGSHKTAPSG